MSFDKTISIYIFDGNPNGRMMCELSNWNGRAYKVSRNELSLFAEREDLKYTCVYFLFGKDEDGADTIYIGEAEKAYDRLKQHVNDTEYWNDCVVLLSKDNHLNKAHVKYLENNFYMIAKSANRNIVLNPTVPTLSSISEYDAAMLKEFISHSKLLVNTLGYKAFEPINDISSNNVIKKDLFSIIAARGANARGILVSDGFTVLKGSIVTNTVTSSMSSSLIKLKERLLQKGIINSENKFAQDYLFTSPSLAAAIVMGRNANGRTEWKNKEGKSIKDIEDEQ